MLLRFGLGVLKHELGLDKVDFLGLAQSVNLVLLVLTHTTLLVPVYVIGSPSALQSMVAVIRSFIHVVDSQYLLQIFVCAVVILNETPAPFSDEGVSARSIGVVQGDLGLHDGPVLAVALLRTKRTDCVSFSVFGGSFAGPPIIVVDVRVSACSVRRVSVIL